MTIKMKPCPFCGGMNVGIGATSAGRHYSICHAKLCQTIGPERSNAEGATVAWNRRPGRTRAKTKAKT